MRSIAVRIFSFDLFMKQVHIFISGSVQGVGFRYFIKSHAKKYSVVGWVSNLPDGRLEAVFHGESQAVSELVEKCRKGPFLAEVKNLDIKEEEALDSFADFQVR